MKLNKLLMGILTVGVLFGCIGIQTFAENTPTYLDLEESQTYDKSQDVEQNYTFTRHGDTVYTNVSKVKLTWKINEITSTYTSNKTWDPDNLQWTEAKKDISVTYNGAEFTLTNYSSYDVTANVKFTVETSLKNTFDKDTYTNNDCTVATPVNHNTLTYKESDFTAKAQTITASLTFKNDNFKDLSATASATKYGTYTITIKKVAKLMTVKEVAYSGRAEYAIDSDLVFDGSTWEEIIANNSGKTVTLSLFDGFTETCTLKASANNKLILEGNKKGIYNIIIDNSEQDVEDGKVIDISDAVAEKIYFYKSN